MHLTLQNVLTLLPSDVSNEFSNATLTDALFDSLFFFWIRAKRKQGFVPYYISKMDSKETKSKSKSNKDENAKAKHTLSESSADDSTEIRVKKNKKKKLASAKHREAGKKHQKVIRDADAPKYPFTGGWKMSSHGLRFGSGLLICPYYFLKVMCDFPTNGERNWKELVLSSVSSPLPRKWPKNGIQWTLRRRNHFWMQLKSTNNGTIRKWRCIKRKRYACPMPVSASACILSITTYIYIVLCF